MTAEVVTIFGWRCCWCATPTRDLVLCRGALVCRACAEMVRSWGSTEDEGLGV